MLQLTETTQNSGYLLFCDMVSCVPTWFFSLTWSHIKYLMISCMMYLKGSQLLQPGKLIYNLSSKVLNLKHVAN